MECNVLVPYKVGDKKQLLLDSFRSCPPDITVNTTSKFHLEIASTRVQNRHRRGIFTDFLMIFFLDSNILEKKLK